MKTSTLVIWFDGKLCAVTSKDLAKMTPGVLRADGVFETMMLEHGRIAFLKDHMKRFARGLKFYKIKSFLSQKEFMKIVARLVGVNGLKSARVRLMAWKDRVVHTAVICQAFSPKSQKTFKGKTFVVKTLWPNPKNLKTLNYRIFREAYLKASKSGFDEAILLNRKNKITEGSRTNLFFVKDNVLYTPSLSTGCLDGVTRRVVISLANQRKLTVKEVEAHLEDILSADEAFLTNSIGGVLPLVSIDKRAVKNAQIGPLTRQFMSNYRPKTSLF